MRRLSGNTEEEYQAPKSLVELDLPHRYLLAGLELHRRLYPQIGHGRMDSALGQGIVG
jgi:hypothetical protein